MVVSGGQVGLHLGAVGGGISFVHFTLLQSCAMKLPPRTSPCHCESLTHQPAHHPPHHSSPPLAGRRYIAQVVTPASPHLLYGLIDEDADVALDSTPPLLGVAEEVGWGLVAAGVYWRGLGQLAVPAALGGGSEVGILKMTGAGAGFLSLSKCLP